MDYAFQGHHPPSDLASMAAQTNSIQDEDNWLANSGANTHIMAGLENLTIQQSYKGNETVAIGNGSGLGKCHIGSSSFQTSDSTMLYLNDILYCPVAAANLLFINKFCCDNDCQFILIATYFLIQDNLTGRILLQGQRKDGLYPIQLQHFTKNKVRALIAHIGVIVSSLIWHNKLGHPSQPMLQHIFSTFQLPISHSKTIQSICSSCQLGKIKQLAFLDSSRVSHAPLELIHSDVWISPLSSINGSKFYVLFIDDFSRYTWFFPIHNKYNVFGMFVKFKCLVENLFTFKIKQFQTDGGGEYLSNTFTNFLSTHGILHKVTCPHTSQQNEIAERKHRHIIETTLTVLAQSHSLLGIGLR
jgi:hypothetical protein